MSYMVCQFNHWCYVLGNVLHTIHYIERVRGLEHMYVNALLGLLI